MYGLIIFKSKSVIYVSYSILNAIYTGFCPRTVVEPALQVHSGARVDRMTSLDPDISLYAGVQPITAVWCNAPHMAY